MTTEGVYRLVGCSPSPFSRKLRAILRYRRLPHVWIVGTADTVPEVAHVRPRLVPILRMPDSGEWQVDSTPIAHLLEARHPDQRSIVPPDAADAFVCHLIEDLADEWVSKMMFHHRWTDDATADWAAHWIVRDAMPKLHGAAHDSAARFFHDRQRSRMAMVGCTPDNAPLIEAGYRRLLDLLAPQVGGARYLFGSRPSLADFALYGQLAQLTIDPQPQRICRERAPVVESWTITLDDGSGIDGEWQPEKSAGLREALLDMIGAEYLPFLAANAAALAQGASDVSVNIRGATFAQAAFPYQAKCYAEIRARWVQLDPQVRASLAPLMTRTGCLAHLVE
ncbi:glutathione S-transferase family protein [Solimonas terrae]|uniref:Glutathione S-transferase n=1 Tax=Solimonas terrae TaxID=1396819 RepID=A0A6M2BN13_9GAMM|nr:glutathione S-transferase N-terminal domain-containing protein [Solimonas terrae]NGY03794.1 glutathione S-transferase [Solimonas terrae]